MAFIYCADIYCDDCGQSIRDHLIEEGSAPLDPSDEWSYDSDYFPKYADDDDASDCPQHCASGSTCVNAIELDGDKVGLLFGELTIDGISYVEEAINNANHNDSTWCKAVVGLWYLYFSGKGYQFKVAPNWL